MKRTIIIGILGGFMMSSCSVTKSSYTTARIDVGVRQHPTVADLNVKPKIEKTVTWNFLFFNYGRDDLTRRRGNLIADMLQENGADIMLEPQAIYVKKPFGKRILTVTGYPASLENFRKATLEEAKQVADTVSWTEKTLYDVAGTDKVQPAVETTQVDKRSTEVIIRAGFVFNDMVAGGEANYWDPGYSAGIEFNTFINKSLYWSAGALFTSRGAGNDRFDFMNHSLQIPVGVGYRLPLTKSFALDAHFAPFFSIDFKQDDMEDGYHGYSKDDWDKKRWDVGLMMGVGIWLNKVNLDFSYQRGFIEPLGYVVGKQSNLMLRLGIAF